MSRLLQLYIIASIISLFFFSFLNKQWNEHCYSCCYSCSLWFVASEIYIDFSVLRWNWRAFTVNFLAFAYIFRPRNFWSGTRRRRFPTDSRRRKDPRWNAHAHMAMTRCLTSAYRHYSRSAEPVPSQRARNIIYVRFAANPLSILSLLASKKLGWFETGVS